MYNGQTYEQYRQQRDDYFNHPSYRHPETGAPLAEPFKPSPTLQQASENQQPPSTSPQPATNSSATQSRGTFRITPRTRQIILSLRELTRLANLHMDSDQDTAKPGPTNSSTGSVETQHSTEN